MESFKKHHPKPLYTLYKIISPYYQIKCTNSKAVFETTLPDIVFKLKIIAKFHPIQACFLGLEFARLKMYHQVLFQDSFATSYGAQEVRFKLYALVRKQQISYLDLKTQQITTINTIKLSNSKDMIRHFSAVEAFYIGFTAGNILFTKKKIRPRPEGRGTETCSQA